MSSHRKRLVDCLYRCPNGDSMVDFNVWPRRGEGNSEACLRKLRSIIREKADLCEEVRVREIKGIGKATTQGTRMRFRDRMASLSNLKRLPVKFPKVKIIREH